MALLEPPSDLLCLLHKVLDDHPDSYTASGGGGGGGQEEEEDDDSFCLAYISFLALGLATANEFEDTAWKGVLMPYLEQINIKNDKIGAVIDAFRVAALEKYSDDDDNFSYGDPDDDDGAEEICDLKFNLAYGGKILLHRTHLRLRRGKRYALVGQNGVGKVRCCVIVAAASAAAAVFWKGARPVPC